MKKTVYFSSLAITVLFAFLFTRCNSPKPYRSAYGIVWATSYKATYASNVDLDDSVRAVLRNVDESVSVFNPNSVVSAINRSQGRAATDTIFRRVFCESVWVNKLSDGAFDPTVAPLVEAWGFGPGNEEHLDSLPAPSEAMIDSMMQAVGIDGCRLLPDGTVEKKSPDTQFNFSAIAKGYACDLVSEMFERNGVTDYMIEIGGEVRVGGISPRQQDWRVMIDAPVLSNDSVVHEGMAIIGLTDAAVATSGNYRNYHNSDKGMIGHTINPRTGRPVASQVLSVTIVAPDCITADAFATACMVMSMDSARIMLNKLPEVSALFVTVDEDGAWELHTTRGFPMMLQ